LSNKDAATLRKQLKKAARLTEIGKIVQEPHFSIANKLVASIPAMVKAWRGTLDW
jgi:hypothetical protein